VRPRSLIGLASSLFPIAQRAEGYSVARRESLLRQAKRAPHGFHTRNQPHAGKALLRQRLRIRVVQRSDMRVAVRYRVGAAQSVASVFVVASPSFIGFCLSG
jgi:hypothetical protein